MILLFVLLLHTIFPFSASAVPHREAIVLLQVVDGDTFVIERKGAAEHLRLIGIDTPEIHDNAKARRDSGRTQKDLKTLLSEGKRAAAYVRGLLTPGMKLKLELDVEERDRYRRLLGYIYFPDGVMVNEKILADGYASLLTIPPNVRYVDRFKRAYERARQAHAGLWD